VIIKVALTEAEVMKAIAEYISRKTNVDVSPSALFVEVKSKQNFKSEWEKAAIRVNTEVFAS
jgi:hypothetical protein